jgi:bifunctional DNA-binding transcriptional regulator/antitoxin component of YhaV-PrlF toxin-antitoxin module
VIPAEARKKPEIRKGAKLLVFGKEDRGVLVLVEVGRVSELGSRARDELTELCSMLGADRKGKGRRTAR